MISLCGRDCTNCTIKKEKMCNGCSMCDVSLCKCGEKRKICMVICPNKFGSFTLVKNTIVKEPLIENKSLDLPIYIPVMPDKIKESFNFKANKNIIAVHGEFFLNAAGHKITGAYKNGFRAALNLKDDLSGILEFYIKDRTLEGFWDNRKSIYKDLKRHDFLGIIAPNFSVYEDAPRLEHIYNIQRSKRVYNEMINEGLPAIPDVSWYSKEDLNFWIREIKANNIKTIAFSFMNVDTKLKASNAWKHYLLGFKILDFKIPKDVQIIVAGISSIQRVEEILKISKDRKISFMHQAAWVNSRNGVSVKDKKQLDRTISKDTIFQNNLNFYIEEYERLMKEYSL
ncbi:DUF4417 domain-containing protein [Clostridium perfringens]|uniref:DUF4417 domain-containing protein n=1 Tax=Clostridium perfringens TaxID=1502 RepID=UPI00224522A1|nr:DUF4417 domain-containing protein [Clostridium perfringens]MCX0356211.1 DUF4417 domain-containing protein [Clostridium perfringens]